jgi:hypothetical protein
LSADWLQEKRLKVIWNPCSKVEAKFNNEIGPTAYEIRAKSVAAFAVLVLSVESSKWIARVEIWSEKFEYGSY